MPWFLLSRKLAQISIFCVRNVAIRGCIDESQVFINIDVTYLKHSGKEQSTLGKNADCGLKVKANLEFCQKKKPRKKRSFVLQMKDQFW